MYSLFVDIKRSTQFLKDFEKEFMFSEVNENQEDDKMETNWWRLVMDELINKGITKKLLIYLIN